MKLVGAAVLAAMLMSAAPASAQVFDLSTVKCKDFLESGKENISLIMMWLDGYYHGEDDAPTIDFDKMKVTGEKLGAACAKQPTMGLISVAEEIYGK